MPHLTDEIKTFIVKGLACYDTPSQVAEAVRAEFDIVVSRQQVHEYDPACVRRPAQRWRDLHAATRAALLRELGEIGIAHRAVRLRRLDRLASRSERNNVLTALKCIEMAAKECGGMYENRKPIVVQPTLPLTAMLEPPAPQPAAIQQPSSPESIAPPAAAAKAPAPQPQLTAIEPSPSEPTPLRPTPPSHPVPFVSVPLPVMPQPDRPASSAPQPRAVPAQTPASPALPASPPLSRVQRYLAYVADRHARDRAVAAQALPDDAGISTMPPAS